jgi:ferrochelatase
VVLAPLGFISDHMEVLFDLDVEAKETAADLGLHMVRAATVGTAPAFVRMIRDLIVERMTEGRTRAALGTMGAWQDICPTDCCLARAEPQRRPGSVPPLHGRAS